MAQLIVAELAIKTGEPEVAERAVARAKDMIRDIPSGDAVEDQAERIASEA
jgi:hypothetical protein